MNPDNHDSQIEGAENRIEQANKPGSFLDSIRGLAHRTHTKVLVLAALAGMAAASGCDMQSEKDKTEVVENENDLYKGCEPFTMCLTTGLYDENTSERIGFSFWYKVPDGQELGDVSFKVLGQNDSVLGEDTIPLVPGTDQFWVTKPGYNGDFENADAPKASGIEVTFSNGKSIIIRNGELEHTDDEPIEF